MAATTSEETTQPSLEWQFLYLYCLYVVEAAVYQLLQLPGTATPTGSSCFNGALGGLCGLSASAEQLQTNECCIVLRDLQLLGRS